MTNNQLTREENVQAVFDLKAGYTLGLADVEILKRVARMALAAMNSEPEYLPLDYLQGHRDGLEWSARLAESNHPQTGDWLYDDPIELAKAIRKGPDMPPAQPVAGSEPDRNPVLAYADSYRDMAKQGVESVPIWSVITDLERNIAPLYRHAQQPVVPDAYVRDERGIMMLNGVCEPKIGFGSGRNACRAAMIAAAQHDTPTLNSLQSVDSVAGKWIPVSERVPENDGAYLCWDKRYVTTYAFIFGAWQANQFIAKNITHWMPLPAAPQEVKGE